MGRAARSREPARCEGSDDHIIYERMEMLWDRLEALREEYAVNAKIAADAEAAARRIRGVKQPQQRERTAGGLFVDSSPTDTGSPGTDGDSMMNDGIDDPSSDLQAPAAPRERTASLKQRDLLKHQASLSAKASAHSRGTASAFVSSEVEKHALNASTELVCVHCNSTNTAQWRKGWHSVELGRPVTLCNACGLKFNKKRFCPICNVLLAKQIGRGTQVAGCSLCRRQVHVECEQQLTGVSPVALNSLSARSRTSKGYFCPECRGQPF